MHSIDDYWIIVKLQKIMIVLKIDIDLVLIFLTFIVLGVTFVYVIFDVHYFVRMFVTMWWARLFQSNLKLTDAGVIYGKRIWSTRDKISSRSTIVYFMLYNYYIIRVEKTRETKKVLQLNPSTLILKLYDLKNGSKLKYTNRFWSFCSFDFYI